MNKNDLIIKTEGVKVNFGDFWALKGIDIEVKRGEIIVILGPSGSGKSTFIRTLNRLQPHSAGSISVNGIEMGEKTSVADLKKIRADVGFVFQQFNLWSHMTVLKNVMEAPVTVLGRPRAEVADEAMALLGKVGIADKADAYPAQLSGGQQQRAAIARALAMRPKALLFDEPTSALDPELELEVVKVIRELAAEGRTMILVTHDMRLARDVSSHVMFLNQGVVEEQGAPEDIFGSPKTERLRQFLHATSPAA